MKPVLMALAIVCFSASNCTKRNDTNRKLTPFEEKILGKWKLVNSSYVGYWDFKSTIIDSLSTYSKTVRQLDIHIPGFCASKGYWSLSDDSILDNSCIPMAKVVKLTNDSLVFEFSSGFFQFDYRWIR